MNSPVARALGALPFILVACAGINSCSQAGAGSDSLVIPIDRTYGTLQFTGSVERIDRGDEYEFRTAIDATFLPEAEVNRVPAARLERYFLAATAESEAGQPSRSLYRDDETINVLLGEDGETTRLPAISFRIPKVVAVEAAHLDLAVSDGRIMWPIGDLK